MSSHRPSPLTSPQWSNGYNETVNTAVIDIGTNTLLLLVVGPHHERLIDVCRFGRLGKGLDATGGLAQDAIARSLDICRDYRRLIEQHNVTAIHVIATQALREANNRAEFIEPAQRILGASIEIITGAMEAELAYTSVAHTFPDLTGAYVVVDVGGGSSEFIACDRGRVVSATSLPIGAVRLAERHLKHDPPSVAEVEALDATIDKQLSTLVLPVNVPLIGTAGTSTTMAAVKLGLHEYDPDAATGVRLSPDAIAELRTSLLTASTAERSRMPGIAVERADVIHAGVAIYARAAVHLNSTVMITCDRGIRWGIVYQRANR